MDDDQTNRDVTARLHRNPVYLQALKEYDEREARIAAGLEQREVVDVEEFVRRMRLKYGGSGG